VSAPDFAVHRASQRYTPLGAGTEDRTVLYQYESGSFMADLIVDSDGFVSDYPQGWRRVWPSEATDA
jgi:uncharacterized protein